MFRFAGKRGKWFREGYIASHHVYVTPRNECIMPVRWTLTTAHTTPLGFWLLRMYALAYCRVRQLIWRLQR